MKTKIVNISLPEVMLEMLDNLAEKEMRSRSDMVRTMIRYYLIKND